MITPFAVDLQGAIRFYCSCAVEHTIAYELMERHESQRGPFLLSCWFCGDEYLVYLEHDRLVIRSDESDDNLAEKVTRTTWKETYNESI